MQKLIPLGINKCCTKEGSHFVFFYEDYDETLDVLSDYVTAGLKNNEKCIFLLENKPKLEKFKKLLSKKNGNKQDFENLTLTHPYEVYFNNGVFDSEFVYSMIDNMIQDESQNRVRTGGFMDWVDESVFNDVREYEETLTKRYGTEKIIFLCAYPLKRLTSSQIIDMIQAHTNIIYQKEGKWIVSTTVEREEYETKIDNLEKMEKISIGRELRMIELKNKIKELEETIKSFKQ